MQIDQETLGEIWKIIEDRRKSAEPTPPRPASS
jgi:hypothetical protein